MIAKDQALRIASQHADATRLEHPDYRMGFELSGRVGDDWLFAYRIHCLKDIPPERQEQFAGAGGFLVFASGEIRDLPVPMFLEAERKVSAE